MQDIFIVEAQLRDSPVMLLFRNYYLSM